VNLTNIKKQQLGFPFLLTKPFLLKHSIQQNNHHKIYGLTDFFFKCHCYFLNTTTIFIFENKAGTSKIIKNVKSFTTQGSILYRAEKFLTSNEQKESIPLQLHQHCLAQSPWPLLFGSFPVSMNEAYPQIHLVENLSMYALIQHAKQIDK
jgi:hypothetical protein